MYLSYLWFYVMVIHRVFNIQIKECHKSINRLLNVDVHIFVMLLFNYVAFDRFNILDFFFLISYMAQTCQVSWLSEYLMDLRLYILLWIYYTFSLHYLSINIPFSMHIITPKRLSKIQVKKVNCCDVFPWLTNSFLVLVCFSVTICLIKIDDGMWWLARAPWKICLYRWHGFYQSSLCSFFTESGKSRNALALQWMSGTCKIACMCVCVCMSSVPQSGAAEGVARGWLRQRIAP